jgi:glycosyltransferase involved in cell wall biosynthesis
VQPIRDEVDEVWCYSHYVRQVYLDSGIPEEKLHIVPLGVDAEVFHPDAPPYVWERATGDRSTDFTDFTDFQDTKPDGERSEPFVFLFVGGSLHRKGIDILLDAYVRAFSAYDDVCLVIKDTGTKTVYRDGNESERIRKLAEDRSRARVVYLDEELSSHQLAGLYTAAHCLVQPYRGEGFCLPALEAMSCGLPVLVTAGGPTDDFVDETVGGRLAAERVPFGEGRIGPWDCVGETWMWEVSPRELARQMRHVFAHPEEAKRKGAAARQRVEAGWTWSHVTQKAQERIDALRQRPARPAKTTTSPVIVPTPKKSRPATPKSDRPRLIVLDSQSEAETAAKPGAPQHLNTRTPEHLNTQRPTPRISLCMIVKNEERVLGDCLKSIRAYVDEIILVDTGSTDRTVEIAKEAGAKVFFFEWCDDFSAARNVSLSHATGDWILWMDADDTILPECGAKLHDLVMLAEERVTGYIMQVHIPPAPGDNGFTIVDHVKLFRNLPSLRFEGRIHEQILEPIYRAGGTIQRSDLYVVHSGYDYSPEGQKHKRARDLRILEKDLAERPDHPFVLFNIGMTAYHLKEWDKAIEALERCRSLSKPHESTVRKVYAMLASSYLERKELDQAKERLEQGLRLFPQDPELNFRGGILYRELGNLAAAELCYKVVLGGRERGHIDSLDVSMTGYKAHHNLGLLYRDMNRLPEAETEWRRAVEENPGFIPSWQGLAQLYLQMRRFEDAQAVEAKLRELEG